MPIVVTSRSGLLQSLSRQVLTPQDHRHTCPLRRGDGDIATYAAAPGSRSGGRLGSHQSDQDSANVNRGNFNSANVNRGNVNRGNVNVNRNVNVSGGGYGGAYYGGGWGGVAAGVAAGAIVGGAVASTAYPAPAYSYPSSFC